MKTYIYALIDPDTNKIRYIGKSNNPTKRLYDHIHSCNLTNTHKNNWIKSLLEEDKKPIVKVLEEVDMDDWQFYEKYWINKLKKNNPLTNLDTGGMGLSKHTYNTKELMKLRHKEYPNYNKCKDKHYLIDKEELYQKYITENLSINECVEYFKIPQTTIFRNLKEYNIIKDKSLWQKQCGHDKNIGRILPRKTVSQFDMEGNLIKEHNGLVEASKYVNAPNPSNISQCCLGKMKRAYGFIWKYNI